MKETANYKLKKPEANDYVSIETVNENMDILDGKLKETSDHIERMENELKVSLPASGWSTEFPYTQTVEGLSCKDGDEPILCKTLDGTESEDAVKAYDKVFGNIFAGSVTDGAATFYAKKLPETNITVCLKGVSQDE